MLVIVVIVTLVIVIAVIVIMMIGLTYMQPASLISSLSRDLEINELSGD